MATKNKTRNRNTTNNQNIKENIFFLLGRTDKIENESFMRDIVAALTIIIIIFIIAREIDSIDKNLNTTQQEVNDLKQQLYDNNLICKNQTITIPLVNGFTGEINGCIYKNENIKWEQKEDMLEITMNNGEDHYQMNNNIEQKLYVNGKEITITPVPEENNPGSRTYYISPMPIRG